MVSRTGLLAAISFCWASGGAVAQTVAATNENKGNPADKSDQLQEIVVTAQKRSENLIEVPISISVISGDKLEEKQIANLDDLARSVADLANTGGNGAGFGPGQGNYEIRGVSGSAGFTSIGQATVGIYLDDVSMTVPTGAAVGSTELKFFDLDHLEVLRGPQGTLYGASSMGGTIRFISNQPDLNTFSGTALTELSDTQHGGINYTEQGVVNLPISTGVLALRLGAQYSHDSGYINAVNPADLSEVTKKHFNDDSTTVVRASLKFQLPDSDLIILPAVLVQRQTFASPSNFYAATPLEFPAYITPDSFDNSLVPSLTIEKGILGATLTSATSYFQRKSALNQDTTLNGLAPLDGGTLFWPSIFAEPNKVAQYSEELRLTSQSMKQSGLPISWVAGIYVSRQTDDTYAEEYSLGNTASFYQALSDTGNALLAQQLATYPGASYPGGSYGAGIDQYSQYTHYEQNQFSVFGEFNYSPVQQLTLTAGLRELIAHQSATEYVGGYYQWFGDNGGTVIVPGKTSSHTLTPKFALRYDFSDTTSVYANAVKGFRLGGINGPVPLSTGCLYSLQQIGLTSAPVSYSPDTLWSYDLGVKSGFLNNRVSVDASVFYIDWDNVQQGITLPGPVTDPCQSAFTANAGKAVSDGVDLVLRGQVTH
jgi:outer membrane receptor protein involved in Fe transport